MDITEKEYLDILVKTRNDYIAQEKEFKKRLKIASYFNAFCLVMIPVFTFWNYLDGGVVILLTALISLSEFYIKFNKFADKLILVNQAITLLNMEYYNYYYNVGKYKEEKNFEHFVEETTKLIEKIELQLNNSYDMDAIKKIDYKSKDK